MIMKEKKSKKNIKLEEQRMQTPSVSSMTYSNSSINTKMLQRFSIRMAVEPSTQSFVKKVHGSAYYTTWSISLSPCIFHKDQSLCEWQHNPSTLTRRSLIWRRVSKVKNTIDALLSLLQLLNRRTRGVPSRQPIKTAMIGLALRRKSRSCSHGGPKRWRVVHRKELTISQTTNHSSRWLLVNSCQHQLKHRALS